jgi:hypothetical protein
LLQSGSIFFLYIYIKVLSVAIERGVVVVGRGQGEAGSGRGWMGEKVRDGKRREKGIM